jgi:tetratricopeptide (TPR) repeat protein
MYFLLALILLGVVFAGLYLAYKYRPRPAPPATAGIDLEMTRKLSDLLEKAADFQESQKLDEAENAYKEILKLRRQQAKDKDSHQIDVAVTLNSLGNLYSDMRKYDLSEAAYAEALEIYRQRSSENPAWLPYVGRTLSNFATLFLFARKVDQAEKFGGEGVDILRQCWKENPDRYGNDLAKTLLVLAHVMTSQKDKDASALALAKEAELVAMAKDIKLKARKMIGRLNR